MVEKTTRVGIKHSCYFKGVRMLIYDVCSASRSTASHAQVNRNSAVSLGKICASPKAITCPERALPKDAGQEIALFRKE
ncbi:hypothetical protein CJD36_004510 [Flavipsychrobacter stenotrophus]|uniref:Uncharacterized protein n=1 Tax=Flavipsychrobacter stenotrophus TaxID=2077091 RepID=A0A2S7T2A7_9BACT|nr:hypothetical protein CJD36_004510 [Flavipsychrobacter stenotrophus]